MKLLCSNYEPVNTAHATFAKTWTNWFEKSDQVKIGVGYVSKESVLLLTSLIKRNPGRKVDLCVGMANFEGLTASQHFALQSLDEYLRGKENGGVYIPFQFQFHGKIQTFAKADTLLAGLVGSSNLSNIVPLAGHAQGRYEVDALISTPKSIKELDDLLISLINDASETFAEASTRIKETPEKNPMLADYSSIGEVSEFDLTNAKSKMVGNSFEIPIKPELKSHLNCYFGKGRQSAQGFIAARHWYESEIILDSKVRGKFPNYSELKTFVAYTDDGYKLQMFTNGDSNKNLRTSGDLTALGRWFKGRMEMAGALRAGQLVDTDVLSAYGRKSFTLTKTSLTERDIDSGIELAVWVMDFGVRP